MKKIRIGLVSHLIRDYNLGCCALAYSNISLMDDVFRANSVEPEYVVILSEPKEDIDLARYTSLAGVTENPFTYRTYPRLKPLLKKPWILKQSHCFEDLDYVVDLCGGDGYTDNYGLVRLLAESVPVIGSKQKGAKVIFGPQTIGPFNTKKGAFIAKRILGKLDTLFVRDQASDDCCERLGLSNITKQVIDVAFALPYEQRTFNAEKINVGLNVSGLLYNGGYNHKNYFGLSFDYKDFTDELISHLAADDSVQLYLVPHVIENSGGVDDDYSVCKMIADGCENVILAPKFSSPVDAKSYISGMDLFMGARMHTTIAAISSGVPVIPISYSRKFNGLYSSLEYPYLVDCKGNLSITDAIKQIDFYRNHIDRLETNLVRSRAIFTHRLDLYKQELKIAFGLDGIGE